MSAPLTVERLSLTELSARADEVCRLALAQDEPTPFGTVAWLESWSSTAGRGREPLILVVSEGNRLLGVLPLMLRRSAGGFRVLEWLAAERSDHAPWLIRSGEEPRVLPELARQLGGRFGDWELISLKGLRPAQCRLLVEHLGFAHTLAAARDVSPRVLIRGSWEDYLGTKSQRHRGNIRRTMRHADSVEELRIECGRSADADLVAELAEVEGRSWKVAAGAAKLRGSTLPFYQAFLEALGREQILEIWLCRYRGKLIAYLITFNFGARVSFYNGAYVEDYKTLGIPKRIAPGTVLILNALKSAHDRQLHSFDFLRGDEPYKAEWTNDEPALHTFVSRRSGPRAFVAELLLVRVRRFLGRSPFVRRIRASLRRRGGAEPSAPVPRS